MTAPVSMNEIGDVVNGIAAGIRAEAALVNAATIVTGTMRDNEFRLDGQAVPVPYTLMLGQTALSGRWVGITSPSSPLYLIGRI